MSEIQHTPEPWRVGKLSHWRDYEAVREMVGPQEVVVDTNSGPYVLASCNYNFPQDAVANARRIVACVNACAGIPIDKLEGKTIDEYVADEAYISGMAPSGCGFGIELNGLACQLLAASFAGQFVGAGAINFLSVDMEHKEIGPFTVSIQRRNGKTPAQLKAEAEGQRDQLLAALEGVVEDIQGLIEESEGVAGMHMNGDLAPWHELEAGGRFERLSHLPEALAVIAAVKGGSPC